METRQITAGMVSGDRPGLRPTDEDRERVKGSVADIVEMVRSGGDAAVRRLTARLDGVDVEHARVTGGCDQAFAEGDVAGRCCGRSRR